MAPEASTRPKLRGIKRYSRTLATIAVVIISLLFIAYVVHALRGHDLSLYATPRAAVGMILAAIMWSYVPPAMALAWRHLLSGLGVGESRKELFAIIGITQLAKYLPGNIGQYIGRVGMSLARGLPARALAATLVIETILMVAASATIGIAAGAMSGFGRIALHRYASELGLVLALVVITAAALLVFRRAAPLLLKRYAPRRAPALESTLIPPLSSLGAAFLLYCSMYVVMGIGLILLAHSLVPSAPHDYWLLISACALAWMVGFVTPGAPGGLGVREALMALILAPVLSAASASVLVIALRISTTLGDVMCFGAGWVILPRRNPKPSKQHPTG